jgi:hypothetical protein
MSKTFPPIPPDSYAQALAEHHESLRAALLSSVGVPSHLLAGAVEQPNPTFEQILIDPTIQDLWPTPREVPMTEEQWKEGRNPYEMLRGLLAPVLDHQPASDRKLRLFACACARASSVAARTWKQEEFDAISRIEEYAENPIDNPEFLPMLAESGQYVLLSRTCQASAAEAALDWVKNPNPLSSYDSPARSGRTFLAWQIMLLHTIFHNPWRVVSPPYRIVYEGSCRRGRGTISAMGCPACHGTGYEREFRSDAWLHHDGDVCLELARAIYAERAFERMPILADALEEAGCPDPEVVRWCRGTEPCWICAGKGTQVHEEPSKDYPCWRCCGTGRMPFPADHVLGSWPLDYVLNKR